MILRALQPGEWDAVAGVIFSSTNAWYEAHRGFIAFSAGVESCRLFPQVYEGMDPGCCVVAEDSAAGRIMGSCFYRLRETHVSLGILNVHPEYFGRGVATKLLRCVTDFADRQKEGGLPVRLVSSAMNLDSFSLYSRAGFVPRAVFATMQASATAVPAEVPLVKKGRVRPATVEDVSTMGTLEMLVGHIRREKDYRLFTENRLGIWHTMIHENAAGDVDGWLGSVAHPASNMIGPGVMMDEEAAVDLLAAQLIHHRGRSPVVLVPTAWPGLMRKMYDWGARNVEVHVTQARGRFEEYSGVVVPTFMPETG